MWMLIFLFFVFLNVIVVFMPKRLSGIEMYSTTMFALFLGTNVDLLLEKYYKLYSYFKEGVEVKAFLGQYLYFIPINLLFLNFYPLNKSIVSKAIYILGWTAFSVGFEWLAKETAFFQYTGWKLWYSAIAYPFIFTILLLNFKAVKKLIEKERLKRSRSNV
ncbi:CBO0543 family protein [Metabacillus sp. Hm71]|uniref:CBO0543 family protein n=1 Tax=Metabacillus sp. Hm71 TaxID=3450743 RepID=UPI003F4268D7